MNISTRSICISLLAAVSLTALPQRAHAFAQPDPAFNPAPIDGWSCNHEIVSPADDSTFVSVFSPSLQRNGIAKFAPDGNRDPAWGQNGISLLASGAYSNVMLTLPDGGVLAFYDNIVRFNAAGTIDTSYGGAGGSPPVTTNGQIHSAALQPDGSVVVLGGRVVIDAYRGTITTTEFTRITPNGQRDATFGAGGYLNLIIASGTSVYAWSIGADGSAEVGTYRVEVTGEVTPVLLHIASPAGGGSTTIVSGRSVPFRGIANWMAPIANVDAFGNLLLATVRGGTGGTSGVMVRMFDKDAKLNPQFGAGGSTFVPVAGSHPIPTSVVPKALWRTADGGWLVLAQSSQSSGGFFPVDREELTRAVRLLASGSPDPAFTQGQEVGGYQFTKFLRLSSGKLVHADYTGTGCKLFRQIAEEPRIESAMVEYYHPAIDHYFMTLEGFESALLDKNVATMGWLRTGQRFGAWAAQPLPGTKRLCRFYGDFTAGPNSHFYTPEGSECDGLRAQEAATPVGRAAWRLEGYAASIVDAPASGVCPANLTPVYRVYNNGFQRGIVSNHRYMSDKRIYDEMVGKGWAPEGVRFCVPPESSPATSF